MNEHLPYWNNKYCLPYYAMTNTKLIAFQYKLLMRVLVTNIHLKLYGIKTYEECDFCKQEKGIYEHLFFTMNLYEKALRSADQMGRT